MLEQIIRATAPSNIALIKYMGKKEGGSNIPENSSISMTLGSLQTIVEVSISGLAPGSIRGQVQWVPEMLKNFDQNQSDLHFRVPALSDRGIGRMHRHFERVRDLIPQVFQRFSLDLKPGYEKNFNYTLRTANTFPDSSGIASSASSFAALTLGIAAGFAKDSQAFEKVWETNPSLRHALARISRQGSGSSCRSFEGPWVLWSDEDAHLLNTEKMPQMAHFVILIKSEPKTTSSSEAHALVRTSPLWEGRPERAEKRVQLMQSALNSADLPTIARLAWSDSWEMHSLFHTCADPFSYWEPGTIDALHWFAPMIRMPSPPIVTLDAGPNVHVIVENSSRDLWRQRLLERFKNYSILEDEQGSGANLRVLG